VLKNLHRFFNLVGQDVSIMTDAATFHWSFLLAQPNDGSDCVKGTGNFKDVWVELFKEGRYYMPGDPGRHLI